VLYIGVAIISAMVVYFSGYNVTAFNYIDEITSEAIDSKNYVEVAKIHGGCFETVNVAKESPTLNSKGYELAVFKSGTLITEDCYVEDKTVTNNKYDYSYYVYLFGLTNDDLSDHTDGSNTINGTAFNFVGTEATYTYYFKVSKDYNNTYYVEKPANLAQALLGESRDLFENHMNWGFVNLTLTETMLDAMSIGDIQKVQVTNTAGNVVYEQNIEIDFNKEEGFFKDITPLVVKYNEYITAVTGDASKDDISKAENTFNEFYLKFEEEFLGKETNSFRHQDSVLQPGWIVWKTIGILFLYTLGVVVLYVLLFNFTTIKNAITKKKYERIENKAKQKEVIDAEVEEIKNESVVETKESKSE
jgi:hypothetical protein